MPDDIDQVAADRHERVTALFLAALDAGVDGRSAEEQVAWLSGADVPEPVRQEVAALLRQHRAAEGLLDRPVFARTGSEDVADVDPRVGELVGPWRIEARIGVGGMGVVYRAARADGLYERTVALKLLHAGPDRTALARRFAAERQILARLEHPGIARLYDGGVTGEGVPYLALELVDGVPITTYAAERDLSVRDRLALFGQVCDAVAYAHRRLVIHRDLKPSNVLVATQADGSAAVKLLDFGIAKLVEDEATDLTRTGLGPMTPSYAAPEQFAGQPVTTATDVYALGVLLYELLAGQRPYDLHALTAGQAERLVREDMPSHPSTVARATRARTLAGDLDQITLRALAKEPERRYASADALADDLDRYLTGLPVHARPDTAGYRIRKFVERHRVGVAVTAAVLLLMAATVGFYTQRLAAERDRAQQAAAEATAQAERAEAVAGFLERILRAPNSRWYNDAEATGPDTPIRVVLDEAAARVERDFADQPDLRADLHHLLGDTYQALGLLNETRYHHRAVLALRESLYTAPHPKIAEALYYAAWYVSDHPADWAVRTRVLRRATQMQRARNEGNNFPFMVESLASAYLGAGLPAEADSLLAEGLAFVTERFGPGSDGARYRDPSLLALAQHRVSAHIALSDLEEAALWLAYGDSLLSRTEAGFPAASRRQQQCLRGRWLRERRRYDEAERVLLQCVRPDEEAVAEPARTFRQQALPDLVSLYDAWGRPEKAAPYRAEGARAVAVRDSLRPLLLAGLSD